MGSAVAALEQVTGQVALRTHVRQRVAAPAISLDQFDAGQTDDVLIPDALQVLGTIRAVEQPTFLLPSGESGCALHYLVVHNVWNPVRSAVRGSELRLKFVGSAAVGDAPRTENLNLFNRANRARVDQPASLAAAFTRVAEGRIDPVATGSRW